jgi:hypothetical protein
MGPDEPQQCQHDSSVAPSLRDSRSTAVDVK